MSCYLSTITHALYGSIRRVYFILIACLRLCLVILSLFGLDFSCEVSLASLRKILCLISLLEALLDTGTFTLFFEYFLLCCCCTSFHCLLLSVKSTTIFV